MEEGEELDDVLIEIEILKEVRHPNIVSYYNSYIDTDSQELWVYYPLLSLLFAALFSFTNICAFPNPDRYGVLLGVRIKEVLLPVNLTQVLGRWRTV